MTTRNSLIAAGTGAAGVAMTAIAGIMLGFGGQVGAEPAAQVLPPDAPVIDTSILQQVTETAQKAATQKRTTISWTDEDDFRFKQIQKKIRDAQKQVENGGNLVAGAASELAKYITGATSPKAMAFTITALEQLGKPYVWAAVGPDTFDCSGLIMYSANKNGISVPRVAIDQANSGQVVSRADARAGDLVEYNGGEHIGIYLGGGKVLHAPQSGDVVRIQPMDVIGSIVKIARIA